MAGFFKRLIQAVVPPPSEDMYFAGFERRFCTAVGALERASTPRQKAKAQKLVDDLLTEMRDAATSGTYPAKGCAVCLRMAMGTMRAAKVTSSVDIEATSRVGTW